MKFLGIWWTLQATGLMSLVRIRAKGLHKSLLLMSASIDRYACRELSAYGLGKEGNSPIDWYEVSNTLVLFGFRTGHLKRTCDETVDFFSAVNEIFQNA